MLERRAVALIVAINQEWCVRFLRLGHLKMRVEVKSPHLVTSLAACVGVVYVLYTSLLLF